MHTVIETPTFIRQAKAAGVGDDEREEIIRAVSENPDDGEIIVGTGGARKLRYARPGTGKSGGYRIITFYAAADVPVFLLDLYGKSQKVTLTQAERNALSAILGKLADEYRKSAKERGDHE